MKDFQVQFLPGDHVFHLRHEYVAEVVGFTVDRNCVIGYRLQDTDGRYHWEKGFELTPYTPDWMEE